MSKPKHTSTPGAAPIPAEQLKCQKPACGQMNDGENNFCGKCGSTLRPDVTQVVRWVLAEELKDREVLERETATAVTERVWTWAKLYGAVVGVAVTLFVTTLAIVGYKDTKDIHKAAEDSTKALNTSAETSRNTLNKSAEDAISLLGKQLKDIETKRKDVQDKLDKASAEVDRLDINRLRAQVNDLQGLSKKYTDLANKVTRLHEDVHGTPLLGPEVETWQNDLRSYREYLREVGLGGDKELPLYQSSNTPALPIEGTPAVRYGVDPDRIILHYNVARGGTPQARESTLMLIGFGYTYHALLSSLGDPKFARDSTERGVPAWWGGLGEGLTCYYLSSFAGHPWLFEDYFANSRKPLIPKRTPEIKKQIVALKFPSADDPFVPHDDRPTSEVVWASTLWTIRENVGKEVADKLISDSWKMLGFGQTQLGHVSLAKWFRDRMIEKAKAVDGGKHVEAIRKAFADRGIVP